MNCPNCGRPVSEAANICPRCKTKLYHNNDNAENKNADGSMKPLTIDEKPLKRKTSPLVVILLIIVVLIVAFAVCCFIIPEKMLDLVPDWKWLEWLKEWLLERALKKEVGSMLSFIRMFKF